MRHLITPLLLLTLASTALAQRERVETRSYDFKAAKVDMEYSLFVPKDYDAKKPAPLVVLLHGLGSTPQQVMRYQGIVSEADKRGYLVVAPFGYNERGWYGSRGQGKKGQFFGRKNDPDNLGELSEKDVLNVLDIMKQDFNVDEDRTYLMGHSMGGAGTIHLGAKYPKIWAALAPLAPALDRGTSRLDSMKDLPVMIATGDKDRLVQVSNVRKWVEEMRKREMIVRYREIEGGDHVRAIASNEELIAEVFDFFDLQKRSAPTKEKVREKGEEKASAGR